MKKTIGLLLASVLVLAIFPTVTHGFTNPLKNYDLYADTHADSNNEYENVMSDYYKNSVSGKKSSKSSSASAGGYVMPSNFSTDSFSSDVPTTERRNDYLRKSSRDVYADSSVEPGWLEGPSFYENPTLESIKEKYHRSNFAGCLQECISYVRQNPYDTMGFYYLAMSYTKVGDRENAIKAYEKVISLQDSPMIVKYATNGRNCAMGDSDPKCYQNVNEPELLYPYADLARTENLTPVDPETLVNRNLESLRSRLEAKQAKDKKDGKGKDKKENKINLPFGEQDSKLDEFINQPYGNGLSPELNKEYTQTQLRKLQQNINNDKNDVQDNLRNIKKFDKNKTDSEEIKIAYVSEDEIEQLKNNPEFIQAQKEINEMNMLFGNSSSNGTSITDVIPYITKDGDNKMSPELVQMMLTQSIMPDYNLINSDDNSF